MKLRLLCTALLVCGVVGCKSSKSHRDRGSTTAPTQSNTNAPPASNTTAPPTSTGPTVAFASFYTATPAVQGEAVIDMVPLPSGELIVGQSGGGLNRVDVNGQPTLESAIGTVGNLAVDGATVYAAGSAGEFYERSGTAWTLSYTHATLQQSVVASLNGEVYAFNSLLGTDPVTGQVLPAQVSQRVGGGAWTPDVASFPNVQITAAQAWNTSVWAGGSDNSINTGGPRLFHGTGAVWNEITLPNTAVANQLEIVTQIRTTATTLWVATMVIDTLSTPAVAVGGNVYETTDGATFTSVAQFNGDAPIALAWHEGTLFVGTLAGRLFHEDPAVGFVEETNLPANLGVFSLVALDAQTLLIGLRGNAGAELATRVTTQAQNTAPPPAASTTYIGDVRGVLMARCASCHANTANAGFTSYPLSTGLTDNNADYNETRMRTNLATPDASPLLRKATGLDGHGGGATLAQGSADYNTLQQWIVDQAPLQ